MGAGSVLLVELVVMVLFVMVGVVAAQPSSVVVEFVSVELVQSPLQVVVVLVKAVVVEFPPGQVMVMSATTGNVSV